MPKVSVVIVSYNAEDSIEKTIQSVINQTNNDYECILVDGNSKDKTLEIAGKYKEHIKKWISEPDRGLYDAMNKGILLAQGEYIIFLNAGDTFAADNMLEKVIPQLKDDIVYGNFDFYNTKTETHIIKKQKCMNKVVLCAGKVFQATEFIKRELLEQLGGFDLRFKIVADYEFNLRAILENNAKVKYIDENVVTFYELKEPLQNKKGEKRYKIERKFVQKMYFSPFEIFINTLFFKFFHIFSK